MQPTPVAVPGESQGSTDPSFSLQASGWGRVTPGSQSWWERREGERNEQQEGERNEPEHLSTTTPQSAADVAAGPTSSDPHTSEGALSPLLEAQDSKGHSRRLLGTYCVPGPHGSLTDRQLIYSHQASRAGTLITPTLQRGSVTCPGTHGGQQGNTVASHTGS